MMVLTEAGKEELALALLLWHDFKCDGTLSIEISAQLNKFAQHLGVEKQLDELRPKLPAMKISPRYSEE